MKVRITILLTTLTTSLTAFASNIMVESSNNSITLIKNIRHVIPNNSGNIFVDNVVEGDIHFRFNCYYYDESQYASFSISSYGMSTTYGGGVAYHSINNNTLRIGNLDKMTIDGATPKIWKESINKIKYINLYDNYEKFLFRIDFKDVMNKYEQFSYEFKNCESRFEKSYEDSKSILNWFG